MTRASDDAIALAFEHGLPYAGLRDEHHDAALVPAEIARAARVVALRGDADHVRLAAAGPDPDLSGLREHLGARRPEIVIAARAEIDAILGPTPAPGPPQPAPIEPLSDPAHAPAPSAVEPPGAPDPGEEPSWLAPAPALTIPSLVALIAVAIALLAVGAAVAVWLTT